MTSPSTEQSAAPADSDFTEYEVLLILDDGVEYRYAALCPALKGCASDGRTREEALAMIEDAVGLYLADLGDSEHPTPATGTSDSLAAEYSGAGFPVEIVKIQVRR